MLANASIRFVNLGIEINKLPKNISIFGFKIAFYGIIISIGNILAVFVIFREA